MRRELSLCRGELDRIRSLPHPLVSAPAAAAWSTVVVGFGNGVVTAGRKTGQHDLITLVAVPAAGAVSAGILRRVGWSAGGLGIRPVMGDRSAGLPWSIVGVATGLVIGKGLYLVVTGDGATRLGVVRLVIGTAAGEELLHRGVVLGLWSATQVGNTSVLVANLAGFGLWHVAGAFRNGRIAWWELAGPAMLGLMLVWARLRFRSVLPAALLHAAGNLLFTTRAAHRPSVPRGG